jgi:predicted dehydrogenase
MDVVRWGILGCGDVTEKKSGPAFQKCAGSRLVAVMRRNGELARSYAERHGVPRWYDDADALISDAEVDAVYVATPPSSHAELALRVLRAKKPCYVEKPLTANGAEGRALVDAFAAAGVPLFAAYYRRALPRFERVRACLGEIGAVRTVSIVLARTLSAAERDAKTWPWRVRPEIAGGGHFVDLACHTLDLLDWLLGPIVSVAGTSARQAKAYPAEDAVVMSFAHESGALGVGRFTFAADARVDEVVITGSEGELRFATFADDPIRVRRGEHVREERIAHPEHIQQPMIQRIVDHLRGGPAPPSTGATALRTTLVMESVLTSSLSPARSHA